MAHSITSTRTIAEHIFGRSLLKDAVLLWVATSTARCWAGVADAPLRQSADQPRADRLDEWVDRIGDVCVAPSRWRRSDHRAGWPDVTGSAVYMPPDPAQMARTDRERRSSSSPLTGAAVLPSEIFVCGRRRCRIGSREAGARGMSAVLASRRGVRWHRSIRQSTGRSAGIASIAIARESCRAGAATSGLRIVAVAQRRGQAQPVFAVHRPRQVGDARRSGR